MKINKVVDIQPRLGACISVSAGFAQAQHGSKLEQLIDGAESIQNTFYEFRVC